MSQASQVESLISGLTDSSGEPLNAGKVYFYVAGTTTDKTVWTDQAKSTPASQPVVLDSQGKALIFADGAYKMVVKDSSDVTLYTHDSVQYDQPDTTWTDYSGTVTVTGQTSMTVTPVTVSYFDYVRRGNTVFCSLKVTGTIGGTPSNQINISLPVTPTTGEQSVIMEVSDSVSTTYIGFARVETDPQLEVFLPGLGNYTAGAFAIRGNFFYHVG